MGRHRIHQEKGIYSITNLTNGMTYIGSTTSSIRNRISAHKSSLRAGTHYTRELQKDFNDLGMDKFKFEVVAAFEDNEAIYLEERKLVNLYRSSGKSYNKNLAIKNYMTLSLSTEVATKISMKAAEQGITPEEFTVKLLEELQ